MKEKTGRTNLEEREKMYRDRGNSHSYHIISLLSRKIKQGIFSPMFSPFRCFLGRVDISYHDKPALSLWASLILLHAVF